MGSPNGILSRSDKKYLQSLTSDAEDDLWDGDETQKRFRIRKKVQAALQDFPGLSGLPRQEYELIFKDLENSGTESLTSTGDKKTGETITVDWDTTQYQALVHMLVFIYKATLLEPTINFEHLVEQAVVRGEQSFSSESRSQKIEDANVNIDKTYRDELNIGEIKQKLENGEQITREELGHLLFRKKENAILEEENSDLDAIDIDDIGLRDIDLESNSHLTLPDDFPIPSSPDDSIVLRSKGGQQEDTSGEESGPHDEERDTESS